MSDSTVVELAVENAEQALMLGLAIALFGVGPGEGATAAQALEAIRRIEPKGYEGIRRAAAFCRSYGDQRVAEALHAQGRG